FLARSAAATTLSVIGGAYLAWLGMADQNGGPHLPSLAVILAATALATWTGARGPRLLGVLATIGWLALAVPQGARDFGWSDEETIGFGAILPFLLLAVGAVLTRTGGRRLGALGVDIEWPALG